MDIMSARCPSCGAPVNVSESNESYLKCDYCSNEMVVQNAIEYSQNYSDADQIANTRTLLDQAILANDIEEISKHSSGILKLIPNDYTAKYFYAYSQGQKGFPNYLFSFYQNAPEYFTETELQRITEHIITHSELKDNQKVINYLASLPSSNVQEILERYDATFNTRYLNEQNYDVVPRDVFICHQSADKQKALEIVKALESDGNSCWISYRNLRPNDAQNYWTTIEEAIKQCRIFLVITSQQAMLSSDVKREMQMAKSMKKARVEYITDKASRTTFFKDFFDGTKWISEIDDPNSIEILKIRIHDELNQISKNKHSEPHPEGNQNLNQTIANELTQRAKLLIENKKYSQAKSLLDNALMYDSKNGKAYIGLLLIESQMPNIESLINSNQKIEDSINYQNAIKFSDERDRYQLKRINDTIVAQIESKNKERLYLNALDSLNKAKSREQLTALKEIFTRLDDYKESQTLAQSIEDKLSSKYNRGPTQDLKPKKTNVFGLLIGAWVLVFFLIPYGWALILTMGILGFLIVKRQMFSQKQLATALVLYLASFLINFFGWVFEL